VPLLIVCTARPELFERRPGWSGGKPNATTIALTPLSDVDTAILVGGLLDQMLLPADVQQSLLAQAGGNPLYAQEYVRMLQDRGLLVRLGGGWALNGEIADPPESIQGIIAARLDALSPEEKSLIQDASVIGRTAWLGALCALTERNPWEADELLHGLERRRLVQRVRRSSIEGEIEFTFGHALTKDVAYSQIRRAQRAHKHEAAAAWIEQLAGERDDKAELLADHYTQALALREALGEDATALVPRALAAFTEAGRHAAATSAHQTAARHFRAALRLTPPEDASARATLLLAEAETLHNAGVPDLGILERALEAQVRVERWQAAALVESLLCQWFDMHEASGEEQELHLSRGADYAARVAPSEAMCQLGAGRARRLINAGQPEQALTLINEIMPAAGEAGLATGRGHLLQFRGVARVQLGDTAGVLDLRDAAQILSDNANGRAPAAYLNLADVVRGLGDMAAADAAYATGGEWASRFALPDYLDGTREEQAYQAYHRADWETSRQLLTEVTTSNPFVESGAGVVRGRIAIAQDVADQALIEAAAVIRYATDVGSDEFFYYGWALEARCHRAQSSDAEALATTARFLARWHHTGGYTARSLELCELAPILAQHGRHDDIRGAALLLPEACRWRDALLLIANGHYAEAADLYTEIGSHPLAADAHLLAAVHATAEGRTGGAARHVNAVLDFAEKTGAELYRRQVEQLNAASA
jgi:hypothetical protein